MITAIIVSLLAGATIVTSRTINAELAGHTSVIKSTFYNYVIGLICSILILPFVTGGFGFPGLNVAATKPWILLGGVFGVVVVSLSNMAVSKISSLSMTLLVFAGQVLAGLLLDMLLMGGFSIRNLLGGLCVTAGLTVNVLIDRAEEKKGEDVV